MNELERHIQATPLADTHEHLFPEDDYIERGPDVLQDLFQTYIGMDLFAAGISAQAGARLIGPVPNGVGKLF